MTARQMVQRKRGSFVFIINEYLNELGDWLHAKDNQFLINANNPDLFSSLML